MSYFICRRAFRDAEGPVPVGSVVDPTGIKRFRFRLQEKHIVEVTEQNFEQYATLFEQRYGVIIPKLDEVPSKESDEEKEQLAKRVEALGLDLPEDLTFEQVQAAVAEAEEKAKAEAEEKAKAEAEEKAKAEAEEKAKEATPVAKATAKAKVIENNK